MSVHRAADVALSVAFWVLIVVGLGLAGFCVFFAGLVGGWW